MQSLSFDFTGAQGQKLSGRLELPDGPVKTYALFAHCFTCTKKSIAAVRITRALAARGIGVLRYDFTGLGDSEGDFADSTFSADVQDIVAAGAIMAEAGFPPQILIGHSLGGAAVLAAALDMPDIKAVATIAAPFDVEHVAGQFGDTLHKIIADGEARVDLGGRPFTVRKSFVDDLHRHDQKDRIAHLHRALLVLHAPQDLTVGINNASSIFAAAKHPKSFVSLDGADHLLTRPADADYAAEVITAWASRYHAAAPAATDAPVKDGEGVIVEETRAGKFQVAVRAPGVTFFADEPVSAGGMGTGPSPYDLVSAGLGACTAMTVRMYADLKQLPLTRVKVAVGHAKEKGSVPSDVFSRRISFEGALTPEQTSRLLEIADKCPVHRSLEGGGLVKTELGNPPAPSGPPEGHERDMEETCATC